MVEAFPAGSVALAWTQVTVITLLGSSTVSTLSWSGSLHAGGVASTAFCPGAPADAATCLATGGQVPGVGTSSPLATAASTESTMLDLSSWDLPML